MIPAYLRPSDIVRAPINLEIASLIGNQGHIGAVSVGATTLPLQETLQVALLANARLIIFDGTSTEIVTVTVAALAGVSSLTVSPLQFAHTARTEYLTDGVSGSLADVLMHASARIENECRQSLLAQSHTEFRRLVLTNRDIARNAGLKIDPQSYPVSSITSMTLQYDSVLTNPIAVDVTQLIINPVNYSVLLPYLQLVQTLVLYADDDYQGVNLGSYGSGRKFVITLVYQSGFAFNAIPYDLQEAAILFACVELAKRSNPTDAQEVMMGKRKVIQRGTSDISGIHELEKEALRILQSSYIKASHVR